MGRKAGFQDDDVFAAVAQLAIKGRGVVTRDLSAATGVSVGSLYHRFGSLDGVLAETWLWAQEPLQAAILPGVQTGQAKGGLGAALSVLTFCKREPVRALVVGMIPRATLLPGPVPEALAERVAAIDTDRAAAFESFGAAVGCGRDAAELAVLRFPLNVVQIYLPEREIPSMAGGMVRLAYWAGVKMREA
jgi:AcrR family transcriptional regulator